MDRTGQLDPNRMLAEGRAATKAMADALSRGDNATLESAALELEGAFLRLDAWLTAGGHLPREWHRIREGK